MTNRRPSRGPARRWLALSLALAATGCNAVLGLGDYSVAGEGECVDPDGCSGAPGFSGGGSSGKGGASGSGSNAVCGDHTCEGSESCSSCPGDCGSCSQCGHTLCTKGTALAETCSPCVSSICLDHRSYCCTDAWDDVCVELAEGLCPEVCGTKTSVCGDTECQLESGETCSNCPSDCGSCQPVCGNGTCQAPSETCTTCPHDCGDCGCTHNVCITGAPLGQSCSTCTLSVCSMRPSCCSDVWDESCVQLATQHCSGACGSQQPKCGDGSCQPSAGETCGTCQADCGSCGCTHDVCTTGAPLDASCASCNQTICSLQPSCCHHLWDGNCVQLASKYCSVGCSQAQCGDGICS